MKMGWAAVGAKRLECAGLPALSAGLGAHERGSKLPHSKRFAPSRPVSIFWSDAMPRRAAPQTLKIEEEDENEDEGGLHLSLPILLILLILSAFSG
jgi:hypothetical protein